MANIPSPKILELGCGEGGLSRKLLENHPTALVTVTDIDPTHVAAVAAGDLGTHPRATMREMDATAMDAPDGYYDLVVFSLSLHHLPPALAARVFAEGTRAGNKLLVTDASWPPVPIHLVVLAVLLPFGATCARLSCRQGDHRRVPHPTVGPDDGGRYQSRRANRQSP